MLLQRIEVVKTDVTVAVAEARRTLLALQVYREGRTAVKDLVAIAAGVVSYASLVFGQEVLVSEASGAS